VQLVGGNNKEWLPQEVKRIVDKLNLSEAEAFEWRVAEDKELTSPVTIRKQGAGKKKVHSMFAVEQQTKLFTGSSRYKNRKLSPQDTSSNDRGWGSSSGSQEIIPQSSMDKIQHNAPLYLGTLSSFAGGCVERCNDPKQFKYTSEGTDVTIYIVDGVRGPALFCMW
jgi:hypothetical protein